MPLLWERRKGLATYTWYFALGMQLSPALQSPFSFHLGCGYARKKKKEDGYNIPYVSMCFQKDGTSDSKLFSCRFNVGGDSLEAQLVNLCVLFHRRCRKTADARVPHSSAGPP